MLVLQTSCTHPNLNRFCKLGENILKYFNSYSKPQHCIAGTKAYWCAKSWVTLVCIVYSMFQTTCLLYVMGKWNIYSIQTATPIFGSKESRDIIFGAIGMHFLNLNFAKIRYVWHKLLKCLCVHYSCIEIISNYCILFSKATLTCKYFLLLKFWHDVKLKSFHISEIKMKYLSSF